MKTRDLIGWSGTERGRRLRGADREIQAQAQVRIGVNEVQRIFGSHPKDQRIVNREMGVGNKCVKVWSVRLLRR